MLKLTKLHRYFLSAMSAVIFFLIALVIMAISLISANRQAASINEVSGEPVNSVPWQPGR